MVDKGNLNWKMIPVVDERIKKQAPIARGSNLPDGFEPGPWTVMCGRGRDCYNNIGNRRFRILIDLNLPKYASAKTKMAKSVVVMNVVDIIRESNGGYGGFVKRDHRTKQWCEVGDDAAREKVGQQFRAALAAGAAGNEKSESPSKVAVKAAAEKSSPQAIPTLSKPTTVIMRRVTTESDASGLSCEDKGFTTDTNCGSLDWTLTRRNSAETLDIEPMSINGDNADICQPDLVRQDSFLSFLDDVEIWGV